MLQFSRRKVDIRHVIWPALLLESTALIMLSIWTAKTEFGWERIEIDEATGESIGKCADGAEELSFWIPIALLGMIPTFLTGFMAWRTIDVDATYSEAKWIFVLMLVHFQVRISCNLCVGTLSGHTPHQPSPFHQVFLIGMPLVAILEDVSTDGRYLIVVLTLFTFPITTMVGFLCLFD